MNTTTPPDILDLEARAHSEHAHELRLWLRLLTCSQLIEKRVRTGLREQFDTTLPRFDLMAQLERHPEGLKMKELSHRLMVTGGNVTGITDQLVAEGLVERQAVDGDRRAFRVRLTPEGRSAFERMAGQHEQWIVDAFEGLQPRELDNLHKLLGKVKQHQLDINQRLGTEAE
jgi:DNA-binding MarR family transcriptional regulator